MNSMMHFNDYRCPSCHKLLFKGVLVDSAVEVKCARCGNMTEFKGDPVSEYVCLAAKNCPHRVSAESGR